MMILTGRVWAVTHYVDPNGSGDFNSIQAAIDDANDGDEIEVAAGTYNEAINFFGKAVRLYSSGGRDVTIIDANGIVGAYHVVQCVNGEDANTILEGFTITGGEAKGPDVNDQRGGGMYNVGSSPMVTNCTFSGNSGVDGGGMYNSVSSPTVSHCTFSGNSSGRWGGGMYSAGGYSTVTDCTFSNNNTMFYGGGMYCSTSSGMVNNCTFSNNSAFRGGGMYCAWYSTPKVTNCTFSGNSGGGMYNANSMPTVTNCTFNGNSAESGGGMCNLSSSPTVTNCTFSNNSAYYGGGGMGNSNNSSPTVTNCRFTGNSAGWGGGGMSNGGNCSPTVTNCTFSNNDANTTGGGIENWENSSLTLTNSILWSNTAPTGQQIDNDGTSWSIIRYSDVEGGFWDSGNIDADPCFMDANNPDPNLRNFRLKPDSPCIDAGDTTAVPLGISLDPDGNTRILDNPQTPDTGLSILGIDVDMGAYEFQPCPIAGDINCDGVVDFKDLVILCNNWLAGTEP